MNWQQPSSTEDVKVWLNNVAFFERELYIFITNDLSKVSTIAKTGWTEVVLNRGKLHVVDTTSISDKLFIELLAENNSSDTFHHYGHLVTFSLIFTPEWWTGEPEIVDQVTELMKLPGIRQIIYIDDASINPHGLLFDIDGVIDEMNELEAQLGLDS